MFVFSAANELALGSTWPVI